MHRVEIVEIGTEYIKLDSLLKLVNAAESGGMAKLAILDGEVKVNGQVCTQRGKKLRNGDKISICGYEYEVRNVS